MLRSNCIDLDKLFPLPPSEGRDQSRPYTRRGREGEFFVGALACALLAACAAPPREAPALHYLCQHGQQFEARLYEDAALLGGQSAQQQLARVAEDGGALSYSDGTLHAVFGLGADGREASLSYAGIPHEVYCRRVDEGAEAVRATPRRVPEAAAPAASAPAAPTLPTNLRTSGGRDSRGN